MSQCPQMPDYDKFMHNKPYVSAVGALMYLAIATRPDITHAVSVLCRFMSKPSPAHWKAAKHLFRYLRGSVDYWLTYAPDPSLSHLFVTRIACAGSGAAGDGVRTSADSATHVAWPQVYILGLESRATNFESTQCAPQARQSMQSLCCHRHLHQDSLLTWAAGRA
jgi:hypothetical protein